MNITKLIQQLKEMEEKTFQETEALSSGGPTVEYVIKFAKLKTIRDIIKLAEEPEPIKLSKHTQKMLEEVKAPWSEKQVANLKRWQACENHQCQYKSEDDTLLIPTVDGFVNNQGGIVQDFAHEMALKADKCSTPTSAFGWLLEENAKPSYHPCKACEPNHIGRTVYPIKIEFNK
jgi:hypothetical protein